MKEPQKLQLEITGGTRYESLEQALAATDMVVVPMLVALIRKRLEAGIYEIVDGQIVKAKKEVSSEVS